MKKNLISNTVLSAFILSFLFVLSGLSETVFSTYHYFSVIFFFVLYVSQSLLLFKKGVTPKRFISLYSVTTVLKLLTSLLFLAIYYFSTNHSTGPREKIYFSLFFATLYFMYLIINTKSQFNQSDEKKSKQESI